jgi:hypothetical protein
MQVFGTPAFQAAHSSRGGSPFTILTAAEQTALYDSFDESVVAFYHHPGSSVNPSRTDDDVEALYQAIGYIISGIVCSLFRLFVLSSYFLFRCSPTSLMIFFDKIVGGTVSSVAYCSSFILVMAMLSLVESPIISLSVPSFEFRLSRSVFFL